MLSTIQRFKGGCVKNRDSVSAVTVFLSCAPYKNLKGFRLAKEATPVYHKHSNFIKIEGYYYGDTPTKSYGGKVLDTFPYDGVGFRLICVITK